MTSSCFPLISSFYFFEINYSKHLISTYQLILTYAYISVNKFMKIL
ncbi:hypothetical protein FUSPEROL_01385 [Fusobacterium periodonticum ATCC 33693]|uniref:Uncharacterized protein n=1 Tax=Fusobacterium periodonticum ATCC 33693 TaxID=546275 RepID=D4CVE1_9FUSO|nr:hypothetical protein FUSPEROL_01385 [Fusobacterium periodonticum ATCC 33693]